MIMKLTKAEIEGKKSILFEKMRADVDMHHISDNDINTMIDILYELEIKHGLLELKDDEKA